MNRLLVVAVVVGIVVLAWRRRASGDARSVERDLLWACGGMLASHALAWGARVTSEGVSAPLLVLRSLALMVALWPFARLSLHGFGARRDRFLRLPLAALATITALATDQALPAVATLSAIAALGYGWRKLLPTGALFRAALLLVATVGVIGFVDLPRARTAIADSGVLAQMQDLNRWARAVFLTWAIVGVFKTFAAFVRDPSLGIRTVSRRLALSHVLVVLVPLLITLALWTTSTWLGLGSERAYTAARVTELETSALQRALAAAASSSDPARAMDTLLAARPDAWPGARVWVLRNGALTRVRGDAIPSESRVAAWIAAPDSVAMAAVVRSDTAQFAGARCPPRADAPGMAVLVPLAGFLAGAPSRIASATVRPAFALAPSAGRFSITDEGLPDSLDADEIHDVVRDSMLARGWQVSGDDSASRERLLPFTRELGVPDSAVVLGSGRGRVGFSVASGSNRLDAEPLPDRKPVGSWTGQAMVRAVTLRDRAVRNTNLSISAEVHLKQALTGLWAHTRDNPLSYVSIVMLGLLAMLLLPVAAFNFAMVGGMGRSITQATGALRRATAALGAGDLAHRIEVRGDDDLWETARQFNRMAEGLERAREAEKERSRLESELEVARRIQARLLPAHPPQVPGLEIAGHSESAREVGGDYYDHIPMGDARALLVIADVSGKGVPAALLMSAFRASLMSQDAHGGDPARLAGRLNEFLHRSVDPGKFVTAFVGFLDGATGRFVYANAGHNPPVLLRANGEVEWLAAGGLILGILPEAPFESGSAQLEPGDLIVLYTDGVTEGADATAEQWGEERLVESLRRRSGDSCAAIAEGLVREVRAFEGETGPADDITVLVARRAGA